MEREKNVGLYKPPLVKGGGPLAVGGLPRLQGKVKNMQEYTKHNPMVI